MEQLVVAAPRGGHEEGLSVARAEGGEVDVGLDLLQGDGHAAVEDLLDERVGALCGGLRLRGGRGGLRCVAFGRTRRWTLRGTARRTVGGAVGRTIGRTIG